MINSITKIILQKKKNKEYEFNKKNQNLCKIFHTFNFVKANHSIQIQIPSDIILVIGSLWHDESLRLT